MTDLSSFFETDSDHESKVQEFKDNLNLLKSMSVEEHTLYKKWQDINFRFSGHASNLRIVKNKIWKPYDIFDYEKTVDQISNIVPKIILVDNDDDLFTWNTLRDFTHSMGFDANIGRNLKFLILDVTSEKYLGILNLASDVISIKSRDEWIGWTSEDRLEGKRLNNTAIGSCILPTQPFGYNFLGGKLIASILTSQQVRHAWEARYKDRLVGFTTTSLYGPYSMYNGIPYWKPVGKTAGRVIIKPDDEAYSYMLQYIKTHRKEDHDKLLDAGNAIGVTSGYKQRVIALIFNELGLKISDYEHGYERGVYFAPIYENTKEFLCRKIDESELSLKSNHLPGGFGDDIYSIFDWWKEKALNRYQKLFSENKLKPEILFYDEMIGMTWQEAKEKYLDQVGR